MTVPLRITVFDYGAGNLHSLVKTLERTDTLVRVEPDARALLEATDALVLPGVGAFAHAAARLAPGRIAVAAAMRAGLPTLGICLGMQLFFDDSDEGEGQGLGVIPGRVTRLDARQVPQIGWNEVEWRERPVDTTPAIAYYANSFVCRPAPEAHASVIAWTAHEQDRFPAAVRVREAIGAQFHPEKSSEPGVRFVHGFLDRARAVRARSTSTESGS